MLVEGPLSPLSSDSTAGSYSSDNESVGRTHRYRVAMTARARQRRMRRMKTDDKTESEKDKSVITPDRYSIKYTERSLSVGRRRSYSNSRKYGAVAVAAVSPASKEDNKATPIRTNVKKNVYVHEIATAAPNTPNPSSPTAACAAASFPEFPLSTPGNESNATEGEIMQVGRPAWSEATTPSGAEREEIFHHNAAAGIVRLLAPDRMFPDAPPKNGVAYDTSAKSRKGGSEFKTKEFNETPADDEDTMRRALSTRMIGPSAQLADLLSQIIRDAESTPEIGRAYATRRKNACGALKVLSGKEENRFKLCWTIGVLDAISSVLNDVKATTLDDLSLNANTDARNRVVWTLLNLAAEKKNRMLICNTGVLEAISACIDGDDGEPRRGCCMVLLQLAKTSETRPLIIRSPGVLDALSRVIEVPKPPVFPSRTKGYKNPYLKMFESNLSPGQSQINLNQSFISPNDTTLSPGSTMHSPEETFTESDFEGLNSPGESDIKSNRNAATLGPVESMYSRDMVTDTEDDATSVSSYSSSSSKSESETDESHTDGYTEDHTDGHTEDHTDGHNESSESENCVTEKISQRPIIIIQSMSEMEICFKSNSEEKNVDDYDADPNQFLHGARFNIFGCLLLLVKSKANAFDVARVESLIKALIGVSKKQASPAHARALTILAHLTRHPQNCHHLIIRHIDLLPMLQNATESLDADARKYALRALQNLSIDNSSKTTIAHTKKMIASLADRCNGETNEEVHAAIAALQNLADEPANLIQFTIVKNCIGTIMSVARSNHARIDEGIETKLTQFMARNTLAKLSYWLRKIATSASQRMWKETAFSAGAPLPLYDAVLQPIDYEQWK